MEKDKDIIEVDKITQAFIGGNIDELMCALRGVDKMKISLPDTKDEDILVGRKFYHYDGELMKTDTLTITYVRSGVVFYKSKLRRKGEFHFERGCVMQRLLEPEIYESDLDPKYFEVISVLGKTRIKYIKKKHEKGTLGNSK